MFFVFFFKLSLSFLLLSWFLIPNVGAFGFYFAGKNPRFVGEMKQYRHSKGIERKGQERSPFSSDFIFSRTIISSNQVGQRKTYLQLKDSVHEEDKENLAAKETDTNILSYFPPKVSDFNDEISKLKTERERALYIVKKGDEYMQKYNSEYDDRNFNIENIERVAGCVAVVRIWIDENKPKSTYPIFQSYIEELNLDSRSKRLKILKGVHHLINKSRSILYQAFAGRKQLGRSKRYY